MSIESDIRGAINSLVKKALPIVSEPCEVIAVNEEDLTIDVAPINGKADILDVQINGGTSDSDYNIYTIPRVGSIVYITFLDKNNAFLSLVTEPSKFYFKNSSVSLELSEVIKLNGDSFGGLVKADELKKELDKTKAVLDAIVSVITGAPIPEAGNGAPSSLQSAINGALAGKSTGDYSNIENENVKQG